MTAGNPTDEKAPSASRPRNLLARLSDSDLKRLADRRFGALELEQSAMHQTIDRVRAEFLEMPGLRLTVAQVGRLFGVKSDVCKGVLDALVDAKFLRARPDGTYTRLFDGEFPHPRPAKARHAPFVARTPAKSA